MTRPLALIIEDDQKLSKIFAMALDEAGFDPTVVYDGQAALDQLAGMTPAVIVLDLHLPHVSGDQILNQIHADNRFTHTRVILATADPLKAEELRPKATLVLLKPISFNQLRDLAARLQPRK